MKLFAKASCHKWTLCFVPGQVIIDKNPGITCVVNKTNTIDSTYRNFQMEVLAGESNMVAKVSSANTWIQHERELLKIHLTVTYLFSPLSGTGEWRILRV